MGRLEDTYRAYGSDGTKGTPADAKEGTSIGFVQALDVLHKIRDIMEQFGLTEYVDAFNIVFDWIDKAVVLFYKIGNRM